MLRPIGEILPETLSRLRVRKPVEASLVCRAVDEVLDGLWDHAVPMRAATYRGGRVTIAVTSSSWGYEVQNRSEIIKEKANAKLKSAAIKEVRTKVSPGTARGEEKF